MKFISIKETKPGEASKIRLILLGTLAFGILTVLLYPLDILAHYFPGLFREDSSCILLNATGLPCPFCGMSRGFIELTKLNLTESLYYNPSSVIFFTFIGIFGFTILLLPCCVTVPFAAVSRTMLEPSARVRMALLLPESASCLGVSMFTTF